MGKPAYIATNLAADAVSVTGLAPLDSSVYPVSYINDEILATPYKISDFGDNITFDLTNSPFISYDSIFVGNHNVSSGGSMVLYTGTVLLSLGVLVTVPYRLKNSWVSFTSQTFKNYAQLQITDFSLEDQLEIGEIVIGPHVVLPRAPMWGIGKTQVNKGVTLETLGGVPWDYELNHYKVFQPTFRFPESEYAAFLAFSDAVGRSPFVYIPNVDSSESYYVKKDRGFDPRVVGPGMDGSTMAHWYDWTPTLRCQSEGIAVNP